MLAFHDTEFQVTQIQQLAQSQESNLLGRMRMVSFWFYPKFQTNSTHNLWSILQITLFIWRQQIMNEETSFMMQARLSELDDRDLKQTWHPGSGGLHWWAHEQLELVQSELVTAHPFLLALATWNQMSNLEQYKKASAKREFRMACTTLYNNLVGIGSEPCCKHESCKLDTNPKMLRLVINVVAMATI